MSNNNFEVIFTDPIRSIYRTTYDAANEPILTRKVLFIYNDPDRFRHSCHYVNEDCMKFPTTRIPIDITFTKELVKCPDDDHIDPLLHIYGKIDKVIWQKIQHMMKPDLVRINGKKCLEPENIMVELYRGPYDDRYECGRWYNFSITGMNTSKNISTETTLQSRDTIDHIQTDNILQSWNKRMPDDMCLVLTSDIYNCDTCKRGNIVNDENGSYMNIIRQTEICNDATHCHIWDLSLAIYNKSIY